MTEVDYENKITNFFIRNSYSNFCADFFISSLVVENDFFIILTWHRSTGDSALLKEIFRIKSAVEYFTNVIQ